MENNKIDVPSEDKYELFMTPDFKWGKNYPPAWTSVFVGTDDEIINLPLLEIFLGNYQPFQIPLLSVVGGMKFLEIYSKYKFSNLILYDNNINEFSKIHLYFKYISKTSYDEFEGNEYLENYINNNFDSFYLPNLLQDVSVIRPDNYILYDENIPDNPQNLDMVFRPTIYPQYSWKPSREEYECVQDNLKHSWPTYNLSLPNITITDKVAIIYDSHIQWEETTSVLQNYIEHRYFRLLLEIFKFNWLKLATIFNIKFILRPYFRPQLYTKKEKTILNLIKRIYFCVNAEKLWKAEHKVFETMKVDNKIIYHDTRQRFGREMNEYNLYRFRKYVQPDKLWNEAVSTIIKNDKNGIHVWSMKNKILVNNSERNYFVDLSVRVDDINRIRDKISNYNFIIFHNILTYGDSLSDLKLWIDICIDIPIKMIISEHLIGADEEELNTILKKCVMRDPSKILYSGGEGLSKRNKFYVYSPFPEDVSVRP